MGDFAEIHAGAGKAAQGSPAVAEALVWVDAAFFIGLANRESTAYKQLLYGGRCEKAD